MAGLEYWDRGGMKSVWIPRPEGHDLLAMPRHCWAYFACFVKVLATEGDFVLVNGDAY